VTPEDALDALPRLVEAFDEPLGNNSAIGPYISARAARESGGTRLLAGDGGDEIFGGNARYTHDRLFGLYHGIPAALRRRVLEPALGMLPAAAPGPLGLLQRYVRRANIPNPLRFYSYEFLVAQEAARLLSPEFLAAVDLDAPYGVIRTHFDRVQASAELDRLMYLDLKVTIGDNDLLKVTRTAELAGVATRFPLLDHPLVEFTGTLPARFRVRGFEKRHLFRHAFRSLLPAEILGKRKHGFGVPTSAWLRSHPGFVAVVRDTLLSGKARQRGYFRAGAIEDLLDRHAADTTPYYGDVLWTFFMLEMWHGSHVDSSAAVVRRR
jgi:asparagine synthase (glutamine-hydrolysing)